MEEKISVIIPVYNVRPYLVRCLDSIISNTYRNLEIICIDDGSTDGGGDILDAYAQKDSRVVVIHQKNGGLSAARNSGMNVASGTFISFVDSDDWIHPQFFEILMHVQKKGDYDFVSCEFQKTSEEKPVNKLELTDIKEINLDLAGIYQRFTPKTMVCCKLYRREITEGKRFIEKRRFPEDVAFNAMVLKDCPDINACIVGIPLYFYYSRPGSLVQQLPKDFDLELAELFYKYAIGSKSDDVKYVFLLEGLKRCFAARLELSSFSEKTACDKQIRHFAKSLCLLKNASLLEKTKYVVLGCCPWLFKVYYVNKKRGKRK